MTTSWQNDDLLVDLLVREATEGLTPVESRELQALAQNLSAAERAAFDATVAAILIAGTDASEAMPAALRDRIVRSTQTSAQGKDVSSASRPSHSNSTGSLTGYASAGWWAAAACFVLAVAGWWPRLTGNGMPIQTAFTGATQTASTPQQKRAELLSSGRALEAAWTPVAQADTPIIGDVVFDPVSQQGFLRFRGIPANDPRLAQYQLWIADADRNQPEPVDGGVFDIAAHDASATIEANGDIIIPFKAKLPVGKPAAFVVTLEQPGGVVVSKQEKVMVLAKVAAGT